jgi:hypothetical protein
LKPEENTDELWLGGEGVVVWPILFITPFLLYWVMMFDLALILNFKPLISIIPG